VQRYFSFDTLSAAKDMLARIRDEFQTDIMAVPWLEEQTKSQATYKLSELFFSVGFPNTWAKYEV
jgi:predicted metalloendopeptidase